MRTWSGRQRATAQPKRAPRQQRPVATTPYLVTAVVLVLSASMVGQGQEDAASTVEVHVAVLDSGKGCGEATWCFTLDEQSGPLEAGAPISLRFHNTGASPHELDVTTPDKADPEHQATSEDDAIGSTPESMPSGGEAFVNLTMPSGFDSLYLWCGVTGHESLGMWLELSASSPDETTDSPAPGALLATLGVLGLAWAGYRRRAV